MQQLHIAECDRSASCYVDKYLCILTKIMISMHQWWIQKMFVVGREDV